MGIRDFFKPNKDAVSDIEKMPGEKLVENANISGEEDKEEWVNKNDS